MEEGGGKDDEEEADCEDLWACGVVSVGGLGGGWSGAYEGEGDDSLEACCHDGVMSCALGEGEKFRLQKRTYAGSKLREGGDGS